MRNRFFALGLLTAAATGLGVAPASAATQHCPDHSSPSVTKVELGGNVTHLALPAGTVVCIKSSTEAVTVVVTGSAGVVNPVVNQHGAPRAISYYVVYAPKLGGTQPGGTQPGTTQPGTTEPGSTQPGTTQPGTTEPGTTEPGGTQPEGTDTPDTGGAQEPAGDTQDPGGYDDSWDQNG